MRVGARDRDQAVPPTRARRRRAARPAPPGGARSPRRQRAARSARPGTHPFAMWEDQRIVAAPALPRPDQRAALRRAPGDHLRPARARRHRRRRQGDPRRQRHARPRAGAARAVGQLAVLARRARPASPRRRMPIFRAFPRVGHAADLRRLGGLRGSGSASWSSRRRDRGLHLPLVRRAPASRTSARSRSARWTRRRAWSTRSRWRR